MSALPEGVGDTWGMEPWVDVPTVDYFDPEPCGEILGPDGEIVAQVYPPRPPVGFHAHTGGNT